MFKLLIKVLTCSLLAAGAGNDIKISKSWGDLTVVATTQNSEAEGALLSIYHRGNHLPITIKLDNFSAVVEDIYFVQPNRIILQGKRSPQDSRFSVLTVIDAVSGRIIDTIWSMDVSFSPDGKKAAYQWRPPASPGRNLFLGALIVYGFEGDLMANRVPGRDSYHGRGVILYPEENRLAQKYFIVLDDASRLSGDRPSRGFTSPIAWSPDSKLLAVVEHEKEAHRLVVIDISSGFQQALAITVPIEREIFLRPEYENKIPDIYPEDVSVAIQELRINGDGKSVTLKPWTMDPWSEQEVTLAIPNRSR